MESHKTIQNENSSNTITYVEISRYIKLEEQLANCVGGNYAITTNQTTLLLSYKPKLDKTGVISNDSHSDINSQVDKKLSLISPKDIPAEMSHTSYFYSQDYSDL